jgi:hypothetical protein
MYFFLHFSNFFFEISPMNIILIARSPVRIIDVDKSMLISGGKSVNNSWITTPLDLQTR